MQCLQFLTWPDYVVQYVNLGGIPKIVMCYLEPEWIYIRGFTVRVVYPLTNYYCLRNALEVKKSEMIVRSQKENRLIWWIPFNLMSNRLTCSTNFVTPCKFLVLLVPSEVTLKKINSVFLWRHVFLLLYISYYFLRFFVRFVWWNLLKTVLLIITKYAVEICAVKKSGTRLSLKCSAWKGFKVWWKSDQ